jgi:hypothetical protein
MRLDPATAAVKIHGGRRWSGSGYWAANGLTCGLGNGLTGGLVDFFCFLFYRLTEAVILKCSTPLIN